MKRKNPIGVSLCAAIVLSAAMVAFFGFARPAHANPIAPPSPESVRAAWVRLGLGFALALAGELLFIEWATRGLRAADTSPWALRGLVLGVNTLTFPITQILVVGFVLNRGWNGAPAELFPLVVEYLAYRWRMPKLHRSGLFTRAPSSLQVAGMTVGANALSFGLGLLLLR